ncbi:MAG: hypothetical protein WA885_24700 [Phormidesmis sp.]
MTTFPGSPKLPKGSIVAIDATTNQVVSTVTFQYNPVSLSRTLQPRVAAGDDNTREEALRLEGAPTETLKLDIEFDATDALEKADATAIEFGVYPQLAALETLIYPTTGQVVTNMEMADVGTIEIVPVEAPLTLLSWGKKRVVPVRLTDFSITEDAYDVNLNPIMAKVSLGLRVLNYDDLPWGSLSSKLFLAHHRQKERMARKGGLPNPAAISSVRI